MIPSFAHRLIQAGSVLGDQRFRRALLNLEDTQKARLRSVLQATRPTSSVRSYSEFKRQFPVSRYSDWAPLIQAQKEGKATVHPSCERFQPTSGSTDNLKWIPYSQDFLSEMDAALAPWLRSQARKSPGVLRGKHYWSLSWLPQSLRTQVSSTDDRDFFPAWKRLLWKASQCGDPRLAKADTFDAARMATAVHLAACSELSFLSVWSPTFALSLFELLSTERHVIASTLRGEPPNALREALQHCGPLPISHQQADILQAWDGDLSPQFFRELWPRLALVSAWDTSSSTLWAKDLQKCLPHAEFEGKGLWATEGVVTIPYEGKMPVALTSHFYEWRDLETQKIHPTWELREGQRIQPILSTGSGLLRYELSDQLLVESFLGRAPSLRFLGRLEGVDLVGEKISPEFAARILDTIQNKTGFTAVALLASQKNRNYRVLIRGTLSSSDTLRVQEVLESELLNSFHYRLARELRQLGEAQAEGTDDAIAALARITRASGRIEGNLKIEPLMLERAEDPLS